jgi:uncharacterized membrane protein YesL
LLLTPVPVPAEEAAASTAARPRITRALAVGLHAAYDHLGIVLLGSLLWFGLAGLLFLGGAGLVSLAVSQQTAGAVLLSMLGGLVAAGIGTGPLTAALIDHARRSITHDEPYWWELLTNVPRLWRRGLALACLHGAVTLVLLVDAAYFLAQEKALWRPVGMLFLYPLLFWWASALLQWPLAVARTEESLWQIVKKSALLLLDNLGYMTVLASVIALITVVCLVTQIGFIFFWAGAIAFLQTTALRELLPKYALLPETVAPTEEFHACEG